MHTGEKFKISACELNFKNYNLCVELAARGPEELDAPVYEAFHPVVLLLGLKRYKVHASFPGGLWLIMEQVMKYNTVGCRNGFTL